MSDSAPPPPPPPEPTGPTGPTGAPQQPASQSSGGMSGDQMRAAVQGAHKFDLAQVGLGVVIFIASLMPFYTYSFSGGGISASASVSAWHGFFGWFAVLLALVATGILVASLVGGVVIPSMRMLVLGLFGAAAVCLILALFVMPGGNISGPGYDDGHGFGYWLALLCALGASALAYMRLEATD